MDVHKHSTSIPVSNEQTRSFAAFQHDLDEWFALPPEEQRRRSEIARSEAAEDRRRIRERDELTIPAIDLPRVVEERMHDRLRWPSGYLNHLAQPYCDCETDREDGWVFCAHARDLWPELS